MADESTGLSTPAILGIGAVLSLVAFAGAVLLLPKQATIERSIEIAAPSAVVYAQVADLEASQAWSPWAAADPTLEVTFGATKKGPGASYSWTGDDSGSGTLTIREATAPTSVVTDMDFGEQGGGTATWTFAETDGGTTATWTLQTEGTGPFAGLFAAFADRMIGPSFEDGLNRLKTQAEAQ